MKMRLNFLQQDTSAQIPYLDKLMRKFCTILSELFFTVRIKCLRMFSKAPEDGIACRFVFTKLLGQ